MDNGTDNTTVDIISLLESTEPPSQQPPQSTEQDGTMEEILAPMDFIHTFVPSMNQSAMKEASKTEEFRQESKRRLFRVIVTVYVWSTARLVHETSTAEGRLAKDVQELLRAERDQDLIRARLSDAMAAVSKAVEMFAQF